MPPNPEGGGIYCFWSVDPVGVSVGFGVQCFVSVHYLLNQSMVFDQTYIYTLLGGGKEFIGFWWRWPYFQGHRGTLKCPKCGVGELFSELVDGF